jgi:hypothetical protein
VLDRGKLIASGTVDELRQGDSTLEDVFLEITKR